MNKRKKSKMGVIIIAIVLILFSRVMIQQQKVLYTKQNEMADVQKKIAEQNKLNEDLQRQKKILNTDEYAEKVARDKLGMIKPGERVFVDMNK